MNPTNYSELFILRRVCSAQLFAYNYIAFSLFQITMNPPVSEWQHLALQNCLTCVVLNEAASAKAGK